MEELAGVLAYHYSAAAELFRASGELGLAGDADAGALRFLVIAGERALGFDTAAAVANLTRAVELTPVGHPERPDVLARFGEALFHAGTWEEAAVALREALAGFRARGDVRGAARILTPAVVTFKNQRYPEAETLEVELLAELEPLGPTPELIAALTEVAITPLFAGRTQQALPHLERALQTAAELGLPRPARSLGFLGWARCDLGDEGGLDDLREALDLAIQAGQGREVALLYNNLAAQLMLFEGPLAALEIRRRGIAYAEPRGLLASGVGLVPFSILNMIDAGLHDEALEQLDERIRWATERSVTEPRYAEYIRFWRLLTARILVLRGQAATTEPWLDELVAQGDEYDSDGQLMTCTIVASARIALGQGEAAASLLTKIAGRADVRESPRYPPFLPSLAEAQSSWGTSSSRRSSSPASTRLTPLDRHSVGAAQAVLEEARGRTAVAAELYANAAEAWASLEFLVEEAYAQCGAGRCLLALGQKAQAAEALERARALGVQLQAAPLLAEIDALRARTLSLSA